MAMDGLQTLISDARVVVIVAYGPNPPDGFRQLGREALTEQLESRRHAAQQTGTAQIVSLHVPHDTVPPSIVMRMADVVLDVRKVRRG